MGYTHYWYYKNPVVELAKLLNQKEEIRRQSNSWMEIQHASEKLPTHDSIVKRISKQVEAFKKIKEDLIHILPCLQKDKDFILGGAIGKGNPEITDSVVCFNGDAATNNNFETFAIQLFETGHYYKIEEQEKEVFGFCKTARRPYDIAVCISLMVIKHHLGSDFRISTDGDLDDWSEPIAYYENYFKRKAPKQLTSYLKKEEIAQ